MRVDHLSRMTKGWFIGDFTPSIVRTPEFEVGVKHYRKGDREPLHVHRKAHELTLVVKGEVRMRGVHLGEGAMMLLEPGEASDFEALADSILVVVKFPSVRDDKEIIGKL